MKTLVSTVRFASPEQMAKLQSIDAEDFSGVVRKVRKEMTAQGRLFADEYYDEAVLALKQFYGLMVFESNVVCGISDALDPFWHSHILHTHQYVTFSMKVRGQYIHHSPLNPADVERVAMVDAVYHRTASRARQFFLDVSEQFFPEQLEEARLVCMGNCNDDYTSRNAEASNTQLATA